MRVSPEQGFLNFTILSKLILSRMRICHLLGYHAECIIILQAFMWHTNKNYNSQDFVLSKLSVVGTFSSNFTCFGQKNLCFNVHVINS